MRERVSARRDAHASLSVDERDAGKKKDAKKAARRSTREVAGERNARGVDEKNAGKEAESRARCEALEKRDEAAERGKGTGSARPRRAPITRQTAQRGDAKRKTG